VLRKVVKVMTMNLTHARSSHAFLWVIAGWVAVAAMGLAIIGTVARGHAAPSVRGGSPPLPTYSQPFVNEQETTVAAAQAAVGFTVPMPNAAAANPGNLTQTWLDNDQPQVALEFDGGKLTIMMGPASYQDPTTEFKTFIAENNATDSVENVNGQPALVIQPGTDAPKSNPAWVEFDQNGTDINIVSESYGTDTLLAVANSMLQSSQQQ
jgi:hypothetical protein